MRFRRHDPVQLRQVTESEGLAGRSRILPWQLRFDWQHRQELFSGGHECVRFG